MNIACIVRRVRLVGNGDAAATPLFRPVVSGSVGLFKKDPPVSVPADFAAALRLGEYEPLKAANKQLAQSAPSLRTELRSDEVLKDIFTAGGGVAVVTDSRLIHVAPGQTTRSIDLDTIRSAKMEQHPKGSMSYTVRVRAGQNVVGDLHFGTRKSAQQFLAATIPHEMWLRDAFPKGT